MHSLNLKVKDINKWYQSMIVDQQFVELYFHEITDETGDNWLKKGRKLFLKRKR